MSDAVKFNENLRCDACGQFGAFDFGDEHLCTDCYENRGSCCPEFGGADLWQDREQAEAKQRGCKKASDHPA